jgi:hypothetical protein
MPKFGNNQVSNVTPWEIAVQHKTPTEIADANQAVYSELGIVLSSADGESLVKDITEMRESAASTGTRLGVPVVGMSGETLVSLVQVVNSLGGNVAVYDGWKQHTGLTVPDSDPALSAAMIDLKTGSTQYHKGLSYINQLEALKVNNQTLTTVGQLLAAEAVKLVLKLPQDPALLTGVARTKTLSGSGLGYFYAYGSGVNLSGSLGLARDSIGVGSSVVR